MSVIDNAFNYCSNNPVVFTDYFGTLANPDTLRGLQDLANLLQSLGGYAAAIAAIIFLLIAFISIIQSLSKSDTGNRPLIVIGRSSVLICQSMDGSKPMKKSVKQRADGPVLTPDCLSIYGSNTDQGTVT